MTKFDSHDHDDALRACWDVTDFGAATSDSDIMILNRAAAAFACAEPETLTRGEYSAALGRVRAAVEAAKAADPERAARVEAEHLAKYDVARLARIELDRAARAALPKVGAPGSKAKKAAARALRYETDPEFRAHCDSFGTAPRGARRAS